MDTWLQSVSKMHMWTIRLSRARRMLSKMNAYKAHERSYCGGRWSWEPLVPPCSIGDTLLFSPLLCIDEETPDGAWEVALRGPSCSSSRTDSYRMCCINWRTERKAIGQRKEISFLTTLRMKHFYFIFPNFAKIKSGLRDHHAVYASPLPTFQYLNQSLLNLVCITWHLSPSTEELFGKNNRGFGLENRKYGSRGPSRWPRGTMRKSWH
jgi:hypothetical protein